MKRVYIALFVLAIVAFFASTEVMACNPQCTDPNCLTTSNPPCCCELVDFNNNITGKGLRVLVIGDEWPMPIKDEGGNILKYKWTYQYLGALGAGGQIPPIYAVAPLCSSPPIVTSLEGGTIITPGSLFLLNSVSPRTVYFYTDKKKIDNMSLELKLGSTVNICRNVEGPVCAPAGIAPDLLPCSSFVYTSVPDTGQEGVLLNPTTGQIDLRFTKNCNTKCSTKVAQCTVWVSGNCTSWVNIDPETETIVDQKKLQSCFSTSEDQACQECIMYTTGSPGCYTISLGGVPYKVPTGCK